MRNKIWGKVTAVVDGDTFLLVVGELGRLDGSFHEDEFKVSIDWLTSEELRRDMMFKSKELLQEKLLGKSVRCTVADRVGKKSASGWSNCRKQCQLMSP